MFLSSLFYKCCESTAHDLWLKDIERILYREPTWEELEEWKADKTFWKNHFPRTWAFIRKKLPCSMLLQVFDSFVKHELNLEPEHQEAVTLKHFSLNVLKDLYNNNNLTKTIALMYEHKICGNCGKKLYLHELAEELAYAITEPLIENKGYPECDGENGDLLFKSFKSRYCFIPDIEGGRTIRKTATSSQCTPYAQRFYYFHILETDNIFPSPEQDMRKAFLLHHKNSKK